jgi:hypothetical protein
MSQIWSCLTRDVLRRFSADLRCPHCPQIAELAVRLCQQAANGELAQLKEFTLAEMQRVCLHHCRVSRQCGSFGIFFVFCDWWDG